MNPSEQKMKSARILVVDDEEIVCRSCERLLSEEGYEVDSRQDPKEGLLLAEQNPYDVILVDLKMPGISGMEFLRRIRATRPETVVVIMTGYAEIATAVEATKLGAFDYIPKPLTPDQLVVAVGKALETQEILSENRYLRRELQSRYKFENMIGQSEPMQAVYDLVARVSATGTTVLIRGESGTGKELIARAIHFNSPRKTMRFVAVDCGALHENLLESELFGHAKGSFTGAIAAKKGLFEVADGGSLFLDEIGNTSLMLQVKLLRVLQERVFTPVGEIRERKTDVRLIAATNRDLGAMVAEGAFREDLFYRLNVVPIHLPPLRARRDDVPLLAEHFVARLSVEHGRPKRVVTPEAMERLSAYGWPGNIRELKNLIERLLIMTDGETIGPTEVEEVLPPDSDEGPPSEIKQARDRAERDTILGTLRQCDWNVSEAARRLGMDRGYLHRKIKRYGLTRDAAGA